jgi:hypothetical protein
VLSHYACSLLNWLQSVLLKPQQQQSTGGSSQQPDTAAAAAAWQLLAALLCSGPPVMLQGGSVNASVCVAAAAACDSITSSGVDASSNSLARSLLTVVSVLCGASRSSGSVPAALLASFRPSIDQQAALLAAVLNQQQQQQQQQEHAATWSQMGVLLLRWFQASALAHPNPRKVRCGWCL